jgi:hypothetical protein
MFVHSHFIENPPIDLETTNPFILRGCSITDSFHRRYCLTKARNVALYADTPKTRLLAFLLFSFQSLLVGHCSALPISFYKLPRSPTLGRAISCALSILCFVQPWVLSI